MPELTYEEWAAYGQAKGWSGPSVCYTHDGLPSTPDEEEAIWEGGDPCIHIIRLYPDEETKLLVEENHAASRPVVP